jgi:hypothetical protein
MSAPTLLPMAPAPKTAIRFPINPSPDPPATVDRRAPSMILTLRPPPEHMPPSIGHIHAASAGRTRFAISPPFSRSTTAMPYRLCKSSQNCALLPK